MIDGGAEFAALRLANEGGTHGSVGAYVVTVGRLRTPQSAEFAETFQPSLRQSRTAPAW